MIHVLAGKLVNENIQLRDRQIEKSLSAGWIRSLELQIEVQKCLFDLLLDYFEQKKIMASDGARSLVEEKKIEDAPSILIVDDEIEFRKMVANALPYFHVLEALRDDHPVLAVSGYLGPNELDDHGFSGYIQRLLKLKSFREIVEQVLELDA